MAFTRPEGGWRFDFQGMKINTAADEMPPTKFPYAKNVRYVKSLQTRPGYVPLFATGPLAIETTCPLTAAEVGVAVSLTLTGSGGVIPYTWSISAGALPTGLSLSSAGKITGTPTVAGLFAFTLRIQDHVGTVVNKACTMTVTQLTITTACPLPGGSVGVAYSQAFAATGGTLPYTWSIVSGALPDGLSMNSSGSVTGTPTTVQVSVFTVKVVDSIGATDQKSCQITVTNPNNAMVFTEDFTRTATTPYSNDLGPKLTVTAAFAFAANKTGCWINHDADGDVLEMAFVSGNGNGGITASAIMANAVAAIHARLEDSDQLSESTCVADNSTASPPAITRGGPSVFQTGTWNSDVPSAYYIYNLPEQGKCQLLRINGSLATEATLTSPVSAPIGSLLTITAKDNGTSTRVRLWVNGVMVTEYIDSSASRLHLPAGTDSLGWMGRFCSSTQYTKWTPLVCAVPI